MGAEMCIRDRTHIIPTVNSAQFGSVRVTSVSERPQGNPATRFILGQDASKKFDNVGQLSIWGIVYTQASGSGFAKEFIGDAHDSSPGGYEAADFRSEVSVLGGGGNNDTVSSVAKGNDAPRHGRGIGN